MGDAFSLVTSWSPWIKPHLKLSQSWTFQLREPINSLYGLSCLTSVFCYSQPTSLTDKSSCALTGPLPGSLPRDQVSAGVRRFEVASEMLGAASDALCSPGRPAHGLSWAPGPGAKALTLASNQG